MDESLPFFQEILPGFVKAYGWQHIDTIEVGSNVAIGLWIACNELDAAIDMYELCLKYRRIVDMNKPTEHVLQIMQTIGSIHIEAGRSEKGIALYNEVIPLREVSDPEWQLPGTRDVVHWLISEYFKLQSYTLAIPFCKKMAEAMKRINGQYELSTIGCVYNIGLCYYSDSDYNQSVHVLQQVVEDMQVVEPSLKSKDYYEKFFGYCNILSENLFRMEQPEESILVLEKAIESVLEYDGPEKEALVETAKAYLEEAIQRNKDYKEGVNDHKK